MGFLHPLARKAKVWPMTLHDGTELSVLVIVTTLVLDPQGAGYRKKLVERLNEAARTFVAEHSDVSDFLLINRAKDWD